MMKRPHLASQGAGLIRGACREAADSPAAGFELLGPALHWLWLHLVLGALLLTKLVLSRVRTTQGRRSSAPAPAGERGGRRGPAMTR